MSRVISKFFVFFSLLFDEDTRQLVYFQLGNLFIIWQSAKVNVLCHGRNSVHISRYTGKGIFSLFPRKRNTYRPSIPLPFSRAVLFTVNLVSEAATLTLASRLVSSLSLSRSPPSSRSLVNPSDPYGRFRGS